MSFLPLEINGQTLQLQYKFKPVLTTRKIYNSSFFHDTQYRHEIANHYRDFKNQTRIRRRRRRSVIVRQVRRNLSGENSYEFREVLPVTIKDYPRFFEVFTPRGRQTLCETRPPDETYNDTLRQIRATDTIKGFEFLFERQYRTTQNKRRLRKCKTTNSRVAPKTEEGNLKKALSADDEKKSKNFYKGYRRKVPLIGQSNNNNNNNNNNVNGDHENVKKQLDDDDDDHAKSVVDGNAAFYLQLASEYYQQGFLKNLKYLESIGARNVHAIKRQKNPTTTTTKQKPREGVQYRGKDNDEQSNGNGNSRPQSAATDTTISTNNSESDVTTPRKPDTNNTGGSYRLARRLLQSIAQRKSFRTSKVSEDWGQIRVNITPTQRQDNNNSNTNCSEQQYTKVVTSNTNCCHSNQKTNTTTTMNDYLNANPLDQKHHNNNNYNSSDYNKVKAQQQREHFHSLIDNLQHLEIGDIDLALPKITLTDYCSSSAYSSSNATTNTEHTSVEATDRTTGIETNQRRNYRVQQQQQQQERVAKFILKQSKFDFNKSLEIPNENIYHSEARPP